MSTILAQPAATAARPSTSVSSTAKAGAHADASTEAPSGVSIETQADPAAQIEEPMQLQLSKNILLGNFTGMTTVQVQAMKLVDPTAELARPVFEATLLRTAPKDVPAQQPMPTVSKPQRGIAGRAWGAVTTAAKGVFRALSQSFSRPAPAPVPSDIPNFGQKLALQYSIVRSDTSEGGLWSKFAKACKAQHCHYELNALVASEKFLANPQRQAFLDMLKSVEDVNLPSDLLGKIERQKKSAQEALPFNRPLAVKLAQDVIIDLEKLLQENVLPAAKFDHETLLAQMKKINLTAR